MTTKKPFVVGAVAYDPKVVTIWEGFKTWFAENDFAFDYVLYSNYETQVAAHFDGAFDVAWNSPLAWLETERIAKGLGRSADAFCMRDTDRDLTSVIVTTAPDVTLNDLKGKTVAVGAPDSPQATWIPLEAFRAAGLEPGRDFEVRVFDRLFGKHGDHIGGERDAAKALAKGEVAAACFIDGNHLLFTREGTLPAQTHVVAQTDKYDHCVFTALDGVNQQTMDRFTAMLLGQSYTDEKVRPLLDLEGLKAWKPGRTSGFAQLASALDNLTIQGVRTVNEFITATIAQNKR